ncbi:hypothetical protein J4732_20655 [Serratia marcescens]|uniref:DNA translocase FtsK n=1 Tax=Serratia marcescens TaxID=615 RepID=A0A939SUY1_SERMA|nr:hypothetical protein [Serratia marcescens]
MAPAAPASVNQHPVSAPAQDATPPLYSFEIPEETPAPKATRPVDPYRDDDEPRTGIGKSRLRRSRRRVLALILPPRSATVPTSAERGFSATGAKPQLDTAAAAAAVAATFMPAFTATSDGNPQVKQGIGPELPRPNPVRIPTAEAGFLRHQAAFAACGQQEQRRAEVEPQQPTAVSPQEEEALQEAALRQAFAEQQSQRYGESYAPEQDDESALQEAELSKAFAEQQSQRYGEGYQQNDEEALQERAAPGIRRAAAGALRPARTGPAGAGCQPGRYPQCFQLLADGGFSGRWPERADVHAVPAA